MQSKLFFTFSVLALVFGLSFSTLADTIRLKDGTIVKGKVVGFRGQQFIILLEETAKGRRSEMKLYPEDIESIEFDGDTPTTSAKNPANTGGTSGNTSSGNTSPGNTGQTESTAKTGNEDKAPLIIGKKPTSTNSKDSGSTTRPNNNSGGSIVQVINSQPPSSSSSNTSGSSSSNTSGTTGSSSSGDTNSSGSTSTGSKVTMKVKVLADNTANGWTNAGIVLKKGQRLRISATGRVSLGNGRFSTPAGVSSLPDKDKLMQAEPTGALIAVVGLDNNDFIFIGANREFIAQRDGILFLGVNEGFLDDNSGAFEVTVEVDNK